MTKESYILINGMTLLEVRKKCLLTQSQVVSGLNKMGLYVTVVSLSMWENGHAMPNKRSIVVLERYYKDKLKKIEEVLNWK